MRWLFLVVFIAYLACSKGMKLEELNMRTESMYWSSFFTHYGLKEGAKIEIAYDIQAQNTSDPYMRNSVSVVLLKAAQFDGWYLSAKEDISFGNDQIALQMCSAPAEQKYELTGTGSVTLTPHITNPYSLIILWCWEDNPMVSSFSVTVENPSEQQLPLDVVSGIPIFHLLGWAYFLPTLALLVEILLLLPFSAPMHVLFVLTGLFRSIYAFVQSSTLNAINEEGEVVPVLAVKALDAFSSILFVISVTLLAGGLNFSRIYPVSWVEKSVYVSVIGLYALFEGMAVRCFSLKDLILPALLDSEEPTPIGWKDQNLTEACDGSRLGSTILYSIVLLLVIVAMNFNITHIRSLIIESVWRPDISLFYHYLKRFSDFRWVFLTFLLAPTFVLIAEVTTLTWKQNMWALLANECLILLPVVYVGVNFSPFIPNAMYRAFDRRGDTRIE